MSKYIEFKYGWPVVVLSVLGMLWVCHHCRFINGYGNADCLRTGPGR